MFKQIKSIKNLMHNMGDPSYEITVHMDFGNLKQSRDIIEFEGNTPREKLNSIRKQGMKVNAKKIGITVKRYGQLVDEFDV